MPDIQLLDEATIEKIAAGEVVERPSSVAKELIENAIDAGATYITIEIKDGGSGMLRVTDNGCGIAANQIRVAFLRHSTSKIRSIDDISRVRSLGFRGEALASICAVAQVELITRTRGALTGTRYVIEGSREVSFEEAGAPEGTTFIVRNLFFNTPARRKFLKSAQTEGGYVSAMVERLALSHPEISFQLIVNDQPKLHTSGNCSRKDVVFHIYGRDIASKLRDVELERDGIAVEGLAGEPSISRGNRNFEHYYINGRYMKSQLVAKAIEEAYRPYLMSRQFPFAVLYISMDEGAVDVNVHPAKMEVRFSNGERLYAAIIESIRTALRSRELVPSASPGADEKKSEKPPRPEEKSPQPFEMARISRMHENDGENQIALTDVYRESSGYQAGFLEEARGGRLSVIGQLFDTYWLIQADDKLYIIDQHAAHEKVLFERNMRLFQNHGFTSQQLSPPIILSLTAQERDALERNLDGLAAAGFGIEEFGMNEYAISAVPDNLYGLDPGEYFLELLDGMPADVGAASPEPLWNKIATASCKAAVKGNQKLSRAEAEELFRELLSLENPYNCPHGRPTMISMSKYEIEKKFKRLL